MSNAEASAAAERLVNAARKLVILGDGISETIISTDKLSISFNPISLRNGNIRSTTGNYGVDGASYIESVWNLTQPPIDPPDIVRINRMTNILESYLESI